MYFSLLVISKKYDSTMKKRRRMQRYLKVCSPHSNYFVNLHADKKGGVRVYAPPEKEIGIFLMLI